MKVLSTLALAVRLGREYASATDAFLVAIEQDQPLPDAVRAFAAETENELDDQAAEVLIDALDRAIEVAQGITRLAADYGPKISEWGVMAMRFERKLRSFRK